MSSDLPPAPLKFRPIEIRLLLLLLLLLTADEVKGQGHSADRNYQSASIQRRLAVMGKC